MSDFFEERVLLGYHIAYINNQTEKTVAEELERAINNIDGVCRCQLCVEDIFMLSLNSLPARYRHSATFRLVKNDPNLTDDMVKKAVANAIAEVSAHPKHD